MEVPDVELEAFGIGDVERIKQALIENCTPLRALSERVGKLARYQLQRLEQARIREHMKTQLSMDVPTSRCFSQEYYGFDPYLDVRFGSPGGWCFGRFIHDPLWEDIESGLPMPDTLILGWTDHTPFVPRRIRCSPALMRAVQRVISEP